MSVSPARASRGKTWLFRLLAVMIGSCFTFALLECMLRLFRPQPAYSRLLEMLGEQYRPGEFIPFTLKSNYTAMMPSMEYEGTRVSISTNRFGLRGRNDIDLTRKPPGVKRILALGDSYTFGLFVGDDETYPAVLERLFTEERRHVEVINAGYADGWGPDEHYAWLVNRGLQFQPDVVVYGFFIGNDIEDIFPEHWVERDEKGLPRRIVDEDIYIDQAGRIRSYVSDNKTVGTDAIYQVPVLRESHLLVLMNRKLSTFCSFGSKGKAKVDRALIGWGSDPFPFILRSSTDREDLREKERLFRELVKGMSEVSKRGGAEFVLLMIPINFQVDPKFLPKVVGSSKFRVQRNYFEELKPMLDAASIKYLDMLQLMSAVSGKYYPQNGEVHFNPKGCAYTAECLKRFLEQHRLP
jgi:lysophospholipase L1-like esterase